MWSRVLQDKLIGPKSSEISPNFMKSEVTLQGLQKSSNTPHPEPHQQTFASKFCSLKLNFNIIFQSTPRSSKWAPSVMFPHQTHACTSSLPQTCRMSRLQIIRLDFITRKIMKLLCMHSFPVSYFLGPLSAPILRQHQLIFPCQCNIPKINYTVDI